MRVEGISLQFNTAYGLSVNREEFIGLVVIFHWVMATAEGGCNYKILSGIDIVPSYLRLLTSLSNKLLSGALLKPIFQ